MEQVASISYVEAYSKNSDLLLEFQASLESLFWTQEDFPTRDEIMMLFVEHFHESYFLMTSNLKIDQIKTLYTLILSSEELQEPIRKLSENRRILANTIFNILTTYLASQCLPIEISSQIISVLEQASGRDRSVQDLLHVLNIGDLLRKHKMYRQADDIKLFEDAGKAPLPTKSAESRSAHILASLFTPIQQLKIFFVLLMAEKEIGVSYEKIDYIGADGEGNFIMKYTDRSGNLQTYLLTQNNLSFVKGEMKNTYTYRPDVLGVFSQRDKFHTGQGSARRYNKKYFLYHLHDEIKFIGSFEEFLSVVTSTVSSYEKVDIECIELDTVVQSTQSSLGSIKQILVDEEKFGHLPGGQIGTLFMKLESVIDYLSTIDLKQLNIALDTFLVETPSRMKSIKTNHILGEGELKEMNLITYLVEASMKFIRSGDPYILGTYSALPDIWNSDDIKNMLQENISQYGDSNRSKIAVTLIFSLQLLSACLDLLVTSWNELLREIRDGLDIGAMLKGTYTSNSLSMLSFSIISVVGELLSNEILHNLYQFEFTSSLKKIHIEYSALIATTLKKLSANEHPQIRQYQERILGRAGIRGLLCYTLHNCRGNRSVPSTANISAKIAELYTFCMYGPNKRFDQTVGIMEGTDSEEIFTYFSRLFDEIQYAIPNDISHTLSGFSYQELFLNFGLTTSGIDEYAEEKSRVIRHVVDTIHHDVIIGQTIDNFFGTWTNRGKDLETLYHEAGEIVKSVPGLDVYITPEHIEKAYSILAENYGIGPMKEYTYFKTSYSAAHMFMYLPYLVETVKHDMARLPQETVHALSMMLYFFGMSSQYMNDLGDSSEQSTRAKVTSGDKDTRTGTINIVHKKALEVDEHAQTNLDRFFYADMNLEQSNALREYLLTSGAVKAAHLESIKCSVYAKIYLYKQKVMATIGKLELKQFKEYIHNLSLGSKYIKERAELGEILLEENTKNQSLSEQQQNNCKVTTYSSKQGRYKKLAVMYMLDWMKEELSIPGGIQSTIHNNLDLEMMREFLPRDKGYTLEQTSFARSNYRTICKIVGENISIDHLFAKIDPLSKVTYGDLLGNISVGSANQVVTYKSLQTMDVYYYLVANIREYMCCGIDLATYFASKSEVVQQPYMLTGKPKILIVDDDISIHGELQEIFGGIFDVTFALYKDEAMQKMRENTYDMFWTDNYMPARRGVRCAYYGDLLIHTFKKLHPAGITASMSFEPSSLAEVKIDKLGSFEQRYDDLNKVSTTKWLLDLHNL